MLEPARRATSGPKYTITYTVPGRTTSLDRSGRTLPVRDTGPVTYMEHGQEIFELNGTRGGWFQADPQLKETARRRRPPQPRRDRSRLRWHDVPDRPSGFASASGSSLAATTAFVVRRRARPSAA